MPTASTMPGTSPSMPSPRPAITLPTCTTAKPSRQLPIPNKARSVLLPTNRITKVTSPAPISIPPMTRLVSCFTAGNTTTSSIRRLTPARAPTASMTRLKSWAVIPVPAAPRLVLKPQITSSLCPPPLQCSLALEAAEAAGVETSSCSASHLLLCQVVVNRGAPLFSAVAVRGSHFPHALVGFGIQSSSLVRDIHIRILWVGLRKANVNDLNHRLRNEVNVLEMSGVRIKGSVDPIRMMMTMLDGEHRALRILGGLGIEESRIPVPIGPASFALRPKQRRHNFVGSVNRELELVAHMRHGAACRTAVTLVIKKCQHRQGRHGNQNQ